MQTTDHGKSKKDRLILAILIVLLMMCVVLFRTFKIDLSWEVLVPVACLAFLFERIWHRKSQPPPTPEDILRRRASILAVCLMVGFTLLYWVLIYFGIFRLLLGLNSRQVFLVNYAVWWVLVMVLGGFTYFWKSRPPND